MNPFDYIKSINQKTSIEDFSGFSAYLTNRVFSVDPAYVHLANQLNMREVHRLPKKAIFDCYNNIIPKNKKWLQYPKIEKAEKEINYIMKHFQVTEHQAKIYLGLINKDELQDITDFFEKRGVRK